MKHVVITRVERKFRHFVSAWELIWSKIIQNTFDEMISIVFPD